MSVALSNFPKNIKVAHFQRIFTVHPPSKGMEPSKVHIPNLIRTHPFLHAPNIFFLNPFVNREIYFVGSQPSHFITKSYSLPLVAEYLMVPVLIIVIVTPQAFLHYEYLYPYHSSIAYNRLTLSPLPFSNLQKPGHFMDL